jgi:uncharacterized coiled-coil protein SlyX
VAQSGNGVDIGTIYQLLTQISARLDSMESRLDQLLSVVSDHTGILAEHSRILAEHSRILADHSRQLADLTAGMASLRGDVSHYHEAVVSQGIHYSDLEGRVLRVERHLRLEPSSE